MLCVILQAIAQVTWHGKGDYFATVLPQGELWRGFYWTSFASSLLSLFTFFFFAPFACACTFSFLPSSLQFLLFFLSYLFLSPFSCFSFTLPSFFLSPFPPLSFLSVPPLPFRPSLPPSLLPSLCTCFFPIRFLLSSLSFLLYLPSLLPFLPSSLLPSFLPPFFPSLCSSSFPAFLYPYRAIYFFSKSNQSHALTRMYFPY